MQIRTALLRGGADIMLEAGQELTVVAVGDAYTSWEGYKDEATGETKIGLSYAKLCRDVKPGSMIKIGDGQITLEVRSGCHGVPFHYLFRSQASASTVSAVLSPWRSR